MKAAYFDEYSKEFKLKVGEQPVPDVGPNDVLVEILYAAVNPVDLMTIKGELKLIAPHKSPQIAGNEMVGIVKKTGSNVKKFKIGDRVFGRLPISITGAFAEYVSVDQNLLAMVPEYLTNEEAAAVPLAALTVIQSLELMDPKPGSSIFISGGTGSLGMIAIPIAKLYGLKVITSGNPKNKEQVLSLGASQFFDYKYQDYSKELHDIDYVLDTVGDKELDKEFKILKPGGHLVSLKGIPNGAFAERMKMPWYKKLAFKVAGSKYDKQAKAKNAKYDFVFVQPNGKQLEEASNLLEMNKIRPTIDSVYDLDHVNEALKKVNEGSLKGKVLLKIAK